MKNRRFTHKFITCLISLVVISASLTLGACGKVSEKKQLLIYADPALETVLPLVGEKFNVLNGKNYDLQFVFKPKTELKKDITEGAGDVVITDSASFLKELEAAELIRKDKSAVVAGSRLALISSLNINSLDQVFLIPQYDEENEEWEETEGYINIEELLPEDEETEDEDADEDADGEAEEEEEEDEELPPLLINENVTKIALCSPESMEGEKAKALINAYFTNRKTPDEYGLILYCNNDEEVKEAVLSGKAQVGICLETSMKENERLKARSYFDGNTVDFYAAYLIGSAHKEDAKLFVEFLQGKDARRFFADFNFK